MEGLPIIILMVFVLGHLPQLMLHVLSLLGGAFVGYLGIEKMRGITSHIAVDKEVRPGRVLLPATLLLQSFATAGIAASVAFVGSLYALLVGTKLGIVLLVSRSQSWLKGRSYHAMLIGSGLLLIGLGLLLAWEGVHYFL